MRFSTSSIITALAALASANTVTFINQDSVAKTIIFTGQENMASPPTMTLAAHATADANFPTGWIGNWYAVCAGAPNVPGMLGEARFDGWNGLTYFDVSAIVNPGDKSGVKKLYPAGSNNPDSGCDSYDSQCANAYYLPDDVQTKTTTENHLICTVGNPSGAKKVRQHARDFVAHARELVSGSSAAPSVSREFVLGSK